MPTNRYTTLAVSPEFRDELRDTADEHDYGSYEALIRDMKAGFNPAQGQN